MGGEREGQSANLTNFVRQACAPDKKSIKFLGLGEFYIIHLRL